MSLARKMFCERISSIRGAIINFSLCDLPPTPANLLHNDSARIIRNGLAVQAFNIFEDFIKARTAELLSEINSSGVLFKHLPEDLQWATTVDAVKAVDFQFKLREAADRISYAQDYTERIASTKLSAMRLADVAFFHSSSNISKENFRDALAAFSIDKPWGQISGLSSRLGISGLPAETVFFAFAQRRHCAAHKANASISEVDLSQSLLDAAGLALCFDILMSKAVRILSQSKVPPPPKTWAISDQATVPLRFIRFQNGRFCEVKEKGKRAIKSGTECAALVGPAMARMTKENGALVVFEVSGVPSLWAV